MSVCRGTKRNGDPCTLPATQGSAYCWNHNPARAEERSRNASRAASAKHSSVARESREARDLIWEVLRSTLEDKLRPGARKELPSIVQLFQTYARLVEIEAAVGDESRREIIALPADLSEKLRELATAKEQMQNSEADAQDWEAQEDDGEEQARDNDRDPGKDEAELSEMEALAEDAVSILGAKGKNAAALRYIGRM